MVVSVRCLCFVSANQETFPWSTAIDITNFNSQFVRIPFFGDIKVNVIDAVHTILIVVESVSQVIMIYCPLYICKYDLCCIRWK